MGSQNAGILQQSLGWLDREESHEARLPHSMPMASADWQGPPSKHPLDGVWGKLTRSLVQARRLIDHCNAYSQSNPVRFDSRRDESGHLVFLTGTWPPQYLGLLLGEVVHNLRSAMDQFAWALAEDHSGLKVISPVKVARAIQFPITRSHAGFLSHPAIKYFSPKAVEIIEWMQPYHADSPGWHPLAIVQKLSNADKHQVLTPTLGQLRLEDGLELQFKDLRKSKPWVPKPGEVQIEPIAEGGSMVNDLIPFIRVKTPSHIAIWVAPLPVRVCFVIDPAGDNRILLAEQFRDLCLEVFRAVDPLVPLFPALNWKARAETWMVPELPG
jgi:hypothetical protein